jgi:hypothetical protein
MRTRKSLSLSSRILYLERPQVNGTVALSYPGSRLLTHFLGVPHSSFYNPLVATNEPPRESIEVRALVYYEANTSELNIGATV